MPWNAHLINIPNWKSIITIPANTLAFNKSWVISNYSTDYKDKHDLVYKGTNDFMHFIWPEKTLNITDEI